MTGKAETDELYLGDYNVRETATPDGWPSTTRRTWSSSHTLAKR